MQSNQRAVWYFAFLFASALALAACSSDGGDGGGGVDVAGGGTGLDSGSGVAADTGGGTPTDTGGGTLTDTGGGTLTDTGGGTLTDTGGGTLTDTGGGTTDDTGSTPGGGVTGSSCRTAADCAPGLTCLLPDEGWHGGFCARPCDFADAASCAGTASPTSCLMLAADAFCLPGCATDDDCRDDYECDFVFSVCGPRSTVGDPCQSDADCGGASESCFVASDGFPGGLCTAPCSWRRLLYSGACGGDEICDERWDPGLCMPRCNGNADCRQGDGYLCAGGMCQPRTPAGATVPWQGLVLHAPCGTELWARWENLADSTLARFEVRDATGAIVCDRTWPDGLTLEQGYTDTMILLYTAQDIAFTEHSVYVEFFEHEPILTTTTVSGTTPPPTGVLALVDAHNSAFNDLSVTVRADFNGTIDGIQFHGADQCWVKNVDALGLGFVAGGNGSEFEIGDYFGWRDDGGYLLFTGTDQDTGYSYYDRVEIHVTP